MIELRWLKKKGKPFTRMIDDIEVTYNPERTVLQMRQEESVISNDKSKMTLEWTDWANIPVVEEE